MNIFGNIINQWVKSSGSKKFAILLLEDGGVLSSLIPAA